MKLDKKMSKIIADLEYLIGSECYNPHSYDGWHDIEGCDFRYPINVPLNENEYIKLRGSITNSYSFDQRKLTPNTVKYMKYKFGANELFIGLGLIKVLEYLEERYNLDFNELENNRK